MARVDLSATLRQRRNEPDAKEQGTVNLLLQHREDSKKPTFRRLIYVVSVCLIFIWVFQSNFLLVGSHGHGHAHDHDDHDHDHEESPAFKYSKHANEKLVRRVGLTF
jgi:hypothetical protein